MALPVLNHLEISLDNFSQHATRFPVRLPTLGFLKIETCIPKALNRTIHTIHAASLIALSLSGWDGQEPEPNLSSRDLESNFPALQHLILGNITKKAPDLEMVSHMFPGIERLTCQMSPGKNFFIGPILATIDTTSSGDGSLRWPKLHTVAVSGSGTPLDAGALHYKIYLMRDAGHPLRKLKLPKSLLVEADAKAMGYLRTTVAVEDFSLDWPTPFAGLHG
ncbi:hypothetical protein FIBSPDRAFT_1044310 [Athelia psychrophila]|uniref:Uncharacterized protein n=1 Tax=Athelia psychrophila TaxID=1759441 RepID=A0A166JRL6_9AGAM|nr:hypothetical protein FIBSPDRAFT_1044310 [Fibularhizoctonia sp. CBS 109695]